MKIVLLVALIIPSLAFAKLGDSKEHAVEQWGNPINIENGAYAYEGGKFYVVQWYNDDDQCIACFYYKKDGEVTAVEAKRFDKSNVTIDVSQWNEVNSGYAGLREWHNGDETLAVVAGLVALGDKNLYCRGYLTDEGARLLSGIIKSAPPDLEKSTTE